MTVNLPVTEAHIAAMAPGPLRDELAYRYRLASRRHVEREENRDGWAERVRTEAEAVREVAAIRYGDLPGICEARRAHLGSPRLWHWRAA